jgi:hypothetical protein
MGIRNYIGKASGLDHSQNLMTTKCHLVDRCEFKLIVYKQVVFQQFSISELISRLQLKF